MSKGASKGIEKGMKLHAMYTDGEYYPATVKKGAKAGGKGCTVEFDGYPGGVWVALEDLKSKALKGLQAKAKAKAKEKKVEYDYSELEKGMRIQAADENGTYYAAEVVQVATSGKRKSAPVRVHFMGYTNASDEWVDGSMIRSKALKTVTAGAAGKGPRPMPPAAKKYLLCKPAIEAPLDPDFAPLVLAKKKYLAAVKEDGSTETLEWALPRADGCARYTLPVFKDDHKDARVSSYIAGVLIQEMIWQRSATSLMLAGPPRMCKAIKRMFSVGGAYEFEVTQMPKVCGTPDKPFEVSIAESVSDLPAAKDTPQVCGQDASGCRLAFDLGKSDIKVVAVKDNEVLYSKETEWDVTNPDPEYHYKAVTDALKLGAEKLPKIEAIGGSATGTLSADNDATWCDIFPNVPPKVYKEKVVGIFKRIAKDIAGDVPLKVINDGEVTALAAVKKIKSGSVLGISMGSSEGGGYANADGNLLGWINEMCYIRLDLNPKAPTDPWSKGMHRGLSHMYLGQRGATKLAAKGGVDLSEHKNMIYPHKDMCTIKHETHAECLKLIQAAMKDPEKEKEVSKIYETVGVYLGYALAQYQEFYDIKHVMILGRVSKGTGGDLMLDTAKKVLSTEFPDLPAITFHTADDHFKAVGQCIAAAALPEIKK